MATNFYCKYHENISVLSEIPRDPYILKLLYANVITLMETYLSSSLSYIIKEKCLIQRLATSELFKKNKVSLEVALSNNMEIYVLKLLNHVLFHNIPDVNKLFKDILEIQVNITPLIREAITFRHHIVHRNGFDYDGNEIGITETKLDLLIVAMNTFISKTDNDILVKYADLEMQC